MKTKELLLTAKELANKRGVEYAEDCVKVFHQEKEITDRQYRKIIKKLHRQ